MKDYDHPIPQITQLLGANSCLLRMTTFFFPYPKPMEKYGEPWKMVEPVTLVVHAHIGDVERKEWLLAKMGT